jgi:integrase
MYGNPSCRAQFPLGFPPWRPGELPTITYRRAWIKARQVTLTAAEQASPLARRPYDLRHACLSTGLNGGVYPTQVAEWAGHSLDVLLRIYAKCVVGQDGARQAPDQRSVTAGLISPAGQPIPARCCTGCWSAMA